MNKIILRGRLTADTVLKQTSNNISCCKFTIATSRKTKEKETDFINCVAWRGKADFICKNFKKGAQITVEGTLQNNIYEINGIKQYTYIVNVDNVEF